MNSMEQRSTERTEFHLRGASLAPGGILEIEFEILRAFVDDPDLVVRVCGQSGEQTHAWRLRDALYVPWLPRGHYAATLRVPTHLQIEDAAMVQVEAHRRRHGALAVFATASAPVSSITDGGQSPTSADAKVPLRALGDTPSLGELSWNRSHGDWFFRHFDHAARTVSDYLLKSHPLLQGRILDVGCGDGIIDLGIALHCEPQCLIGIDPFGGFNALPRIMAENLLPADAIPACLEFQPADGNHLPFEDDSFDVVLSWGSLEHIAGGYAPCLAEIRRVLRPDGLLFAHPGLYYSNAGHHLGEFSSEPFLHLRRSAEELRNLVFSKEPERMDRSGDDATQAQYWQWYLELNRITVSGFEREMRELGFEPWRVALRTEDIIEYVPEVLEYPMQDLATLELYTSWWNRKGRQTPVPPAALPRITPAAATDS